MIRAERLGVAYPTRSVLDALDFDLPSGSSTALVGPNGSGKTTLLNVVAGLRAPSSGRLTVDGNPSVAYVLQRTGGPHWLPLTVAEVLRMGAYGRVGLLGRLSGRDRALVAEAAERLEVTDLLDRQLAELSGGQRQRALVAQALVRDADLLLLDEPVTGLDLPSQGRILDLVGEETGRGRTVMMSTHHLDEARRCDLVMLLAGRLVALGPPDDVLDEANLRAAFGDRVVGSGADVTVHDDHGH